MVTDQTTDISGAVRQRLSQQFDLPEFVKQASDDAITGKDQEGLPARAYADSVHLLFPCHTKAATFVSAMYFADQYANIKEAEAGQIERNLQNAAAFWNISTDVASLWTKMAKAIQAAQLPLSDDMFAIIVGSGEDRKRLYPLRNPLEIKRATAWLSEHRKSLAYADRMVIADRILTKVASMQVMDIPADSMDMLNRCAGFGGCDMETAATACEKRATMLIRERPDVANELRTLADQVRVSTRPLLDNSWRTELAQTLDAVDNHTKLANLYGQGLDFPEDELFKVTTKVANAFLDEHFTTPTGAIYEKAAFDTLDVSQVRQWMGDELADILVEAGNSGTRLGDKLATVAASIPKPDARLFDQMASTLGINPVHAEKQAEMSQSLREELAATYRQQVAG